MATLPWFFISLEDGELTDEKRVKKMLQEWAEYGQKQQVRKMKKQGKKAAAVRKRDWLPDQGEDWDDVAAPAVERVVPVGEQERRKQMWDLAARRLEADAEAEPALTQQDESLPSGLVIEVSTGLARVEVANRVLLCTLRGTLTSSEHGFTNAVAVGDRVRVSLSGPGQGVIESIQPRRSALARPDVFLAARQQVLVANADQLLAVASWAEPAFWPELVDRYLIAAQRYGLKPIICLNKVDLATDLDQCRKTLAPYRDLGYRVIYTSTLTGLGVAELKGALAGHETVLAGLSGVGKSSLLKAIEPALALRVAAVSGRKHEGRHTTTQATLIHLDDGIVVDTPGIREFGLSGMTPSELDAFYPELRAAGPCRFPDCTHQHEPGCAVRLGVEQGRISAMRFDSYTKIRATLR